MTVDDRNGGDEMILTRRQAVRIAKQGKDRKDAVVKILRDLDFPVLVVRNPDNPFNVELRIYNSDRTMTKMLKTGNRIFLVGVEKMSKDLFAGEEE